MYGINSFNTSVVNQKIAFGDNNNSTAKNVAEFGTGAGAVAGGSVYAFNQFNTARKIGRLSNVVDGLTATAKTTSKFKRLTQQFVQNAKRYKDLLVKMAEKSATGKFAARIVKSGAFKKVSGVLGGIGAGFVFISGLVEMGSATAKIADKVNS